MKFIFEQLYPYLKINNLKFKSILKKLVLFEFFLAAFSILHSVPIYKPQQLNVFSISLLDNNSILSQQSCQQ